MFNPLEHKGIPLGSGAQNRGLRSARRQCSTRELHERAIRGELVAALVFMLPFKAPIPQLLG
jgi:hypothetical protein